MPSSGRQTSCSSCAACSARAATRCWLACHCGVDDEQQNRSLRVSILVGTASWTDKTLIDCGRFYPKEAKTPEARLRYYASIFPMVEVDSSYYAIPAPPTAQAWAERTPDHFVFNVKAFRLFTGHQTQPNVLHKDIQQALAGRSPRNLYYKDMPAEINAELWRRFHEALAPLKSAGKLGLVHFQFPPWLMRNREGVAHVTH